MNGTFEHAYGTIPVGLESECSKALNAVPMGRRVTVKYTPQGESMLLVGGKPSQSLNTLVLFLGVDSVLDILSAFGRATTTYRERNETAF